MALIAVWRALNTSLISVRGKVIFFHVWLICFLSIFFCGNYLWKNDFFKNKSLQCKLCIFGFVCVPFSLVYRSFLSHMCCPVSILVMLVVHNSCSCIFLGDLSQAKISTEIFNIEKG